MTTSLTSQGTATMMRCPYRGDDNITPQARDLESSRSAPGISGFQAFRLVQDVKRNPLVEIRRLVEQFGPIFRVQFAMKSVFIVTCPDAARHILQRNYANYTKETRRRQRMNVAIANSLFTTTGPYWRKRRKVLQQAFRAQLIRDQVPALWRNCDTFFGPFSFNNRQLGDGAGPINMSAFTEQLVMSLTLRNLFGCDDVSQVIRLSESLMTAITFVQSRLDKTINCPTWLPTKKNRTFREAIRYARSCINGMCATIDNTDTKQSSHSIIDYVRQIDASCFSPLMSGSARAAYPMNELAGFLAASFDTTSTALMWFWHVIKDFPQVVQQVSDEVRVNIPEGQAPTSEMIDRCQYLDHVLSESMRLSALLWTERRAKHQDTVCGYDIPAGSVVLVSPHFLHRNPAHWEDPDRFDPSRFERTPLTKRNRFSFLPFGGGPHVCIGAKYAMLMMKVIIARTLSQYEYSRLSSGSQQIPVVPVAQIAIRPSSAIYGQLKQRSDWASNRL